MAKPVSNPSGALADLPKGASVTPKGSTTVAPLKAPVNASLPPPPPVPANPLLAPGAPPETVHQAITRVVRGHESPGIVHAAMTPPIPGRAFNSTFDAPPVELLQNLALLQNLRSALGGLLDAVHKGIIKADEILKAINAIPLIDALAAKEGIDLVLAQKVLDQLTALLDEVKPPVSPAPIPAPAESPPTEAAETSGAGK